MPQVIPTGNVLVDFAYMALDFFYQLCHNYGGAIILLTIALKAIFYPLSVQQYTSMAALQTVQPKVKEMQKKHANDPKRMQQEMMAIYKEHGVNPFGGCLPVLIQLPVLFVLFAMLSNAKVQLVLQSAGAGSAFFWLDNLAKPEFQQLSMAPLVASFPFFKFLTPLVVLMAVSTWLAQATIKTTDKSQAQMMMLMPLMMLFISVNFQTGLLLYWVASNLLTAAQQYYLSKQKPVLEKIAVIEVENKH